MSGDWKDTVARRPLLAALGAIVGVGAAGGLLYEGAGLLRPHAGADLFSGLGDMESAALLGRAVLAQTRSFDPQRTARRLHDTPDLRPLPAFLSREAARGEVMEVRGWVLPETLAWLCALAARKS